MGKKRERIKTEPTIDERIDEVVEVYGKKYICVTKRKPLHAVRYRDICPKCKTFGL